MAAILAHLKRRNRYGSACAYPASAPRMRRCIEAGACTKRSASRLRAVAALALLTLLACAAGTPAQAQTAPAAIRLELLRNLDFGRFAVSQAAGGAVTISPAGPRSSAGGVLLLASGIPGPASFHVSRDGASAGGQAVSVSLPADGSVELSSGARRMRVNGFQAWPPVIGAIPDGALTLSIGASLEVAPGQGAGSYTGAFSITINYE
ncbi:MAG: DUF4402 domain-containing protein [Massilia sp.]